MFERICIPPKEPRGIEFDLGVLAESLIFYKEVHLIVGATSLQGLLQQLGPDLLLELIADRYLQINYKDHLFAAFIKGKGTSSTLYDVGTVLAEGTDVETVAREAFKLAIGKSGRGRRLAARFCKQAQLISYPETITQSIMDDMQEGQYIEEYIRRRLAAKAMPANLTASLDELTYRFTLVPGRGFQLHSNLNLEAMRAAGVVTSELEDPATVLTHYGTTVADMSLWAQLQSEAALNPRQADVVTARVDEMLAKETATYNRVSAFQDFLFDDARAIREAVNAGACQFRELLPVFAKARKFSEWLSNQSPDIDLIKNYHKEVTAETWIDKLPATTARWSLFTGAGVVIDALGAGGIGTATAVALSALDKFLLDRIVKGWKPHHFVEGPLKQFLDKARRDRASK
jgi:hypothetical protein